MAGKMDEIIYHDNVSIRKPICVSCEVEFKVEENGVLVAEMFQGNSTIYRIWRADLWKCPVCHAEIIHGFSEKATEHFEKDCLNYLAEKKKEGSRIYFNNELRPYLLGQRGKI